MNNNNQQIDRDCVVNLKDEDCLSKQLGALQELNLSVSDVVVLLAHYQIMSENDDDDVFDNWLDALSKDQRKVLQAYEVARGQIEHSH